VSFLFIIQQQFRAENTLLSGRINNKFLFINLATVRQKGILFPHLQQAVDVVCNAMDNVLTFLQLRPKCTL